MRFEMTKTRFFVAATVLLGAATVPLAQSKSELTSDGASGGTGIVGPSMSPSGPVPLLKEKPKTPAQGLPPQQSRLPGVSNPAGIVGPSMSPSGPPKTGKVETKSPAKNLPQQQLTGVPPMLTYEAILSRVDGSLPPRIGGWSCASLKCQLRTSGTADERKAREVCQGLYRMAKDQSVRLVIDKFRVVGGATIPGSTCSA